MRFINHSCAPNARLYIGQGRVEFYALRDIAPGEEITVNYGETHHEGSSPAAAARRGASGGCSLRRARVDRFGPMRSAAAALALVVACAGPAAAQVRPDPDAAVRLMVEQSNAFRRAEGIDPLRADATLSAAAQGFADYMAKTDRYAHEADGRTPAQRIEALGYAFCAVAENIGFAMNTAGFATAELATTFVEGWKNSPPHRRNLLSTDASEIGVGVAQSARSRRFYAVQVFARPQAEAIRFSVTNQSGREVGYRLGDEAYRLRPLVTRTHTICSPAPLAVAGAAPLPAAGGARFTIEGAEGALQLRRD